ncbi:MAG: hypothetical protein IKS48_09835 [Eubacterium sp.]|nr:hypothetical protein [Eubacterium sp.]
MCILIWNTLVGLLSLKNSAKEISGRKWIYLSILLFCFAEYSTSTASCFWMGDSIQNPYFWFDVLLSLTFLLFPPALRKAVDR